MKGSRWFERFEGFLMECLLKNHFQVRVAENCFFLVYRPCCCSLPEGRLVVCETENGSSLTFAGTQSSNMSDGNQH